MIRPRCRQKGQGLIELIIGVGALSAMVFSVLVVSHLSYSLLILGRLTQRAAACRAQGQSQPQCRREFLKLIHHYRVQGEIERVRFHGESLQSAVHVHWRTRFLGRRTVKGDLAHLKGPL